MLIDVKLHKHKSLRPTGQASPLKQIKDFKCFLNIIPSKFPDGIFLCDLLFFLPIFWVCYMYYQSIPNEGSIDLTWCKAASDKYSWKLILASSLTGTGIHSWHTLDSRLEKTYTHVKQINDLLSWALCGGHLFPR